MAPNKESARVVHVKVSALEPFRSPSPVKCKHEKNFRAAGAQEVAKVVHYSEDRWF